VTAPLRPRRPKSTAGATSGGLSFDVPGGPHVALCGLVGGAGTSTLAYALASAAARLSEAPVLLCEADPTAGSLATLAGGATPHSFSELALAAAAGRPPERPFAELRGGLRLVASDPRRRALPAAAALPVLRQARAAHGLTVVDCGTLARLEALPALELATHILWVLPATPLGLARARSALEVLAPRPGRAAESLIAVATAPAAGLRARDLRPLAESRTDHLVLIPHLRDLVRGTGAPSEALAPTLADLATILRRATR
jgi:hypothetical protein